MPMSAEDPGKPNLPGKIDPRKILLQENAALSWWRNSYRQAPSPLAFTRTQGRFSGPELPHAVLYLGADPIACFWESGLGRDLNDRMPGSRIISESDLKNRIEYRVRIKSKKLSLFNATDAVARRSLGAKTAACFLADHSVSRAWAKELMTTEVDGILYESTRHSPGLCLALFETEAALASLSLPIKVGSSYDNATLLAALFQEGISIIGE